MKKQFLLSVLVLFMVSVVAQDKIYVATNGDDNNIGSLEKPLQTLAQAVALTANITTTKVDIILRKGVYYPEATIVLNANELKGKSIRITAFDGEAVVINAAKSVSLKWSKFNTTLYAAKVNLDFEPDALFINGKTTQMARYPNYDAKARFFNGTASDALSVARTNKWENPTGGFFHALHAGEWGSFHYKITEKTKDGSLKMIGGWQNNRPSPLHAKLRFVENIFEELDAPGEWFYNKIQHVLYYYPQQSEDLDNATVELSHLNTIISLKGNEKYPTKNIAISNIKFTGTKRVLMEKHEPLLRSDWMLHRAGAITFEGTTDCSITSCTFSQLGGTAVLVSGYNQNTTIQSSNFQEIGGSGICFVGDVSAVRSPAFKYEQFLDYNIIDKTAGPQNNLYPKNCLVYNNLIRDIGKIEKQATGIEISMSENITIKNNTIYNTPRAGINIGDGTWGGHTIAYNDVFNTVLETGDHGAFNSWGRDRFWNANRKYMDSITTVHPEIILLDAQKPTIINNNRFRCDHGWDIDLDDGSSNYIITNNICLNGGIKLREGFFRTVENNIMINNSFHPHVWFAKSEDVFRRNIVTRNYYPIVISKWGKEVDYNFFPDATALSAAQKNGTDKNSLAGNPMFFNANQGDYTISASSLAHEIGFKNIETENIGVISPNLRAKALKVPIPKLQLPDVSTDSKNLETEWLDVILRNINGLGDRSAYGLASESGVVVVSVKESALIKSGLLAKDVIIGSNEMAINDIFGLMSLYQGKSWTGKLSLNIMRDQQLKKIVIQLK